MVFRLKRAAVRNCSQVVRILRARMNKEELKEYFDLKFRSLAKDVRAGEKRKREDSEFKYKANQKQFEFNVDIKEDIQGLLDLIKVGSQ